MKRIIAWVRGLFKGTPSKKKGDFREGPGYIYMFRHPSMSWRFYKIGMTSKKEVPPEYTGKLPYEVDRRLKEWSKDYGVTVIHKGHWYSEDAFDVEQAIHKRLDRYNHKGPGFGKEFFKVSKWRAKKTIKNLIK